MNFHRMVESGHLGIYKNIMQHIQDNAQIRFICQRQRFWD